MAKKKLSKLTNDYMKALGDNASIVSKGTIYDNSGNVDTGNYLLNAQISGSIYGGVYSSKILALAGEEQTGKTFLLLSIVKNYLNQNEEGFVVFFESEGAIDKNTFEKRGIDSDRVILVPVVTVQDFRTKLTNFVEIHLGKDIDERVPVFMCLDSLGMLPSDKEVTDAVSGDDKTDMTRAKIIKSTFRIVTAKLAEAKIPFIFTNHVYATMSTYSDDEMGGGSGLKYSASNIIFLKKSQYKEKGKVGKEKTKEVHSGITVKSVMKKSRDMKSNTSISFVIHHKKGVDRFSGMVDFCIDKGLLEKNGNKYYWYQDNPDTAIFRKKIEDNIEEFFNDKRLAEFEKFCKDYFSFGV